MEQLATTPAELLELQQSIVDRIAGEDELDSILDHLCRLVEALRPGSICSIMRVDPATGNLFVRSAPCAPPELVEQLNGLIPGELAGGCGVAVFTGQMVIVEDAHIDPRWESMRDAAIQFGIRSCWSIPVRAGESRIVGTFAISGTTPAKPTADELRLLETAGHLAAISITHHEARERIREQQRLLQGILEGIEDPISVKDRQLKYIVANPAEAHRNPRGVEDLAGRDAFELFPKAVAAREQEIDRDVLEYGGSRQYEETLEANGSGSRTFLVRKSPLLDESGEPLGVIGVARDITDLRRAEAALLQSQKLESLGVMAAGVAHDFNNILASILSGAEGVLLERGLTDAGREGVEIIRTAALRARELTHQMLFYAGKAESDKQDLELPAVLEELLDLVNLTLPDRVTVAVDVEEGLPSVEADATQLRQVFLNLICNASEAFEGGGGRVAVGLRSTQRGNGDGAAARSHVEISVTDEGVGMDAATVSKIFDPFFSTKFAGRGLGLAAVQGIVSAHQGEIEVQSAPGSGTSFRVFLPLKCGS